MSAVVEENVRISEVPPYDLAYMWPTVKPWIERGLRYGEGDTLTAEELYQQIAEKRALMWVRHKGLDVSGCAIFDLRRMKGRRIIFVKMLAGRDLGEWLDDGLNLLSDYAKLHGAEGLRASCRPGMARLLKSRGWRQKAVVMELK